MSQNYKFLFNSLPISVQKKTNFEQFFQNMKIFELIGPYVLNKKLNNLHRLGFIVGTAKTREYAVTCNFNITYCNEYRYDIRPVYYGDPGKFTNCYIKYKNIIDLESEEFMEIPEVANMIIKNKII